MIEATQTDQRNAQTIAKVEPTAHDAGGSVMYATGLSKWGDQLVTEVNQQRAELEKYHKHLTDTIRQYGRQEDDTMVQFKDYEGSYNRADD